MSRSMVLRGLGGTWPSAPVPSRPGSGIVPSALGSRARGELYLERSAMDIVDSPERLAASAWGGVRRVGLPRAPLVAVPRLDGAGRLDLLEGTSGSVQPGPAVPGARQGSAGPLDRHRPGSTRPAPPSPSTRPASPSPSTRPTSPSGSSWVAGGSDQASSARATVRAPRSEGVARARSAG
ncbi:MAG: hypothetical protein M0Z82_01995, partial [Actinomycetota bacterium]|nr:hypothetical protein [Actinomycetota bacterium]